MLDKYRIDELYGAVIIRPIVLISTNVLWKGMDAALIDGAVNGSAAVRRTSPTGCGKCSRATFARMRDGWRPERPSVIAFMVWKGVR